MSIYGNIMVWTVVCAYLITNTYILLEMFLPITVKFNMPNLKNYLPNN